jgi:hypothetical protein
MITWATLVAIPLGGTGRWRSPAVRFDESL